MEHLFSEAGISFYSLPENSEQSFILSENSEIQLLKNKLRDMADDEHDELPEPFHVEHVPFFLPAVVDGFADLGGVGRE